MSTLLEDLTLWTCNSLTKKKKKINSVIVYVTTLVPCVRMGAAIRVQPTQPTQTWVWSPWQYAHARKVGLRQICLLLALDSLKKKALIIPPREELSFYRYLLMKLLNLCFHVTLNHDVRPTTQAIHSWDKEGTQCKDCSTIQSYWNMNQFTITYNTRKYSNFFFFASLSSRLALFTSWLQLSCDWCEDIESFTPTGRHLKWWTSIAIFQSTPRRERTSTKRN